MSSAIVLEPYTAVEVIAPGVSRFWSADRRVAFYTIDDSKRPIVDAWMASVRETALNWPNGQPIRARYEILAVGNPQIASYVASQIEGLSRVQVPASKVYAAMVLPNALLVGLAHVVGMTTTLGLSGPLVVSMEAFADRDKALEWLLAQPD